MALTAEQITAQNFQDFYRQILPYLNKGNGGTSDTPLGQVAFFDDLVAPYGWLVADGSTYNIADYPDLANQYERVHGSKNYWGGDGTTTFAVPNWQGEFLRASGTNSHANQGSGANVGTHQNGDQFPVIGVDVSGEKTLYFYTTNGTGNYNIPRSGDGKTTSTYAHKLKPSTFTTIQAEVNGGLVTVRPTNTSLLLCIKAIPSSEMNTYSLTERIVGTWIDGKPLYEKTVTGTLPTTTTDGEFAFSHINLNVSIENGWIEKGFYVSQEYGYSNPIPMTYNNVGCYAGIKVNNNVGQPNTLLLGNSSVNWSGFNAYVTVQYTKTTD